MKGISEKNMKLSWVNKGEDFEIPKITVEMEDKLLEYMEKYQDMNTARRFIKEFTETIYMVLNIVDKNVTREMIGGLDVRELGELYTLIRSREKIQYTCPHCKKSFAYSDMPLPEGDKNFRVTQPRDTTRIKEKS